MTATAILGSFFFILDVIATMTLITDTQRIFVEQVGAMLLLPLLRPPRHYKALHCTQHMAHGTRHMTAHQPHQHLMSIATST